MRENRAPSGYVKASGVEDPDEPSGGVNLTLVYSLLAVALLAAIVIALFIVLPFYRH